MNDENWERKKLSFKNALDRLKESLQLPIDHSIIIDGVIQRFEFTYELAWKWMKQYLEFNGVFEAKSPRDVIKHSFVVGIILDGDAYIEMMKDRNTSAHTYDEAMAQALYLRIQSNHYPLLQMLYERLREEVIES
jgi:nucleotidyltransferase substrate binding protein (TIGR01987 family)